MKNITVFFVIGIISIITTLSLTASENINVIVKVISEDNVPISQADVQIGFRHIRPKGIGKGWGSVVDYHPAKGKTDDNGIFAASDNTSPNVVVSVTKQGFYKSTTGILFDKDGNVEQELIKIVLKKKRNPVPMYAKNTAWAGWIDIPVFAQPIGYDLEVGDWIAPYGKGKISDFIFQFDSKTHEISYTLTFSNPNDGIQEYEHPKDQSSYKWPFTALKNGYETKLSKSVKYIDRKRETNLKKKVNYIYRLRTVTDKKGQIVQACYGKIPSEIEVTTNGKVKFSYYFNPDGTPNLEFDTTNNLFFPKGARKQDKKYRNLIWSQ